MRLFIVEKPRVGATIAEIIGAKQRQPGGYYEAPGTLIGLCQGHLFELAEPDYYTPDTVPTGGTGRKIWRIDELPIIPSEWHLAVKKERAKRLEVLSHLVKRATHIVHVGDADREGQLLVDEVLDHFGVMLPVSRMWLRALDRVGVERSLAAIEDGARFRAMGDAARARQRADWLIGMNLSRAYTLRAQRGGSRVLITVGRVQTPTLALVVERDRAIEAHKPTPYWVVQATVSHPAGAFRACWRPKAAQPGLDEKGRLTDAALADALVAAVTGKAGIVTECSAELKQVDQPLPYDLTSLTLAASRWGYGAAEVLAACQALYDEHSLISYPRTDCRYLPASQHAEAPAVLAAIKATMPALADLIGKADPLTRSPAWDDGKVEAHHGMIPTLERGRADKLKPIEQNLYALIARAYVAQFLPKAEHIATEATVTVAEVDECFTASGKVPVLPGWREAFDGSSEGDDVPDDDVPTLPPMVQGDAVTIGTASADERTTKAPPRFSEATLQAAMASIDRYVSDPVARRLLREGDGLGTSATRAAIIQELKEREYLTLKGKHIVSTQLGRAVADALPAVLKSPVLTALYERQMQAIQDGAGDLDAFVAKQVAFVRDQVTKANEGAVQIAGAKEAAPVSTVHRCMACSTGLSRRPSKKGGFWWGCANFPTCRQTYPDVNGKPDYSRGRNPQPPDKESTKRS